MIAAVKTSALALAFAAIALAPGRAQAEGTRPFVVQPMNDHIEITVPGAKAVAPHASARFDFIEVELSAALAVIPVADSSDDATFKRVQMSDSGTPRVRIQLHHSAGTTAKIAAVTRVVAAEDGVHISFPRKEALASWTTIAAAHAGPVMEGPAAPAPKAAAVPAAVAGPAAPAASASAPEAAADPLGASPAAGATQIAPPPASTAAPLALPSSRQSGPPVTSVLFVLGICGAGGLLVLWARKRRPNAAPEEAIRVLASRSLGGKSKVVLLAAGDREMLLSVSDRGTAKLIGRWRRGDNTVGHTQAASLRAALADDGDDDAFMLDPSPSAKLSSKLSSMMASAGAPLAAIDDERTGSGPTRQGQRGPSASPAVAGLLKLRRGDSSPNLNAFPGGTGVTADADWQRALSRSEGNEA
jgi:flagellar biogenesis protein FliO